MSFSEFEAVIRIQEQLCLFCKKCDRKLWPKMITKAIIFDILIVTIKQSTFFTHFYRLWVEKFERTRQNNYQIVIILRKLFLAEKKS